MNASMQQRQDPLWSEAKQSTNQPKLRPYQDSAINGLVQSLGKGLRRPVLQMATGGGKTLTTAELIRRAEAKGNRTLFVCDSLELVEQAVKAFDSYGLQVGVMQADHYRTDESCLTQVCTAQTLERRINRYRVEFERYPVALIVIDECFVAGTKISSPNGDIEIQNLSVGDEIYCASGVGSVAAVMKKLSNSILKIGLSNGSTIECTSNHPIFTSNGWVDAGALVIGSRLYSKQDMRELWRGDETENIETSGRSRVCERQRDKVVGGPNLLDILLEEVDESYARESESIEGVGNFEKNRAQAGISRREWHGPNEVAKNAIRQAWERMDTGAHSQNQNQSVHGKGHATSLQDRSGKPSVNDSDRAGRWVALHSPSEGAGQQEGCVSGSVWVESIQAEESGGDRYVYNIEVCGHPSYFAENVLVHNCHIQYKVRDVLAELYPNAPIIGLTATPFAKGMGAFFNDVVSAVPMQGLIDQGYLCPFVAYAPFVPDMKGVKQVAGDFSKDAAAEIYNGELVADIVQTWVKHGKGRPTLAFACNVAHSKAIAAGFVENGINAVHVDGYGGSDEDKAARHQKIQDYKNGKIEILSSVGICTKGFDAPATGCLIIARPTKSLSLHWQIVGRALRTHESKTEAVILDHAGNFVRHGFPTDPIDFELNDGTVSAAKTDGRKEGEKLPVPCGACQTLKIGHKCPSCGFAPEKQNTIVNVEGELVKLDQIVEKKTSYTKEEKQRWYSEIRGHAKAVGMKDGWIAHTYRDKFGVWPKGLSDEMKEPSEEVSKFIKHKFIKFQKGKKSVAAA